MDTKARSADEIAADIQGQTMITRLAATVETYADQPAYSDKADGRTEWRTLTWSQVREHALDIAAALIQQGLQPGDTAAIMASSRIDHLLADLGVLHAGGLPMSIYSTLSGQQIQQICDTAAPRFVFLEGNEQRDRWQTVLPTLDAEVYFFNPAEGDPTLDDLQQRGAELRKEPSVQAALQARLDAITPEDTLTLLFTSGTTGAPKGVQITHTNVIAAIESSLDHAGIRGNPGTTLSYLPLAHIAERVLGLYGPQYNGGHVHFIGDPLLLIGALAEVRPSRFFGVPRVWEKIRSGLSAVLAAEPDADKRAAVQAAFDVGVEWVSSQEFGNTTSPELQARFEEAHETVLRPIKSLLGLDRVEWAVSASAPMPLEVAEFFAGLGFKMYDAYGMTETAGAVCGGGPDDFKMGTVGRAMEGVEIKVAEDGEVLTRSLMNTPGYLGSPEATAELIDAEGWLHTGDIGEMDEDGFLRIIDRKKEMIILSSGKNIAPSTIENYLKESPVIGHAMVVGEARHYIAALLTLDPEALAVMAPSLGIEDTSLEALAAHPVVRDLVKQAVEAANARVSRPEQVKTYELLDTEWLPGTDMLTPTMKLRRRRIQETYAETIDGLYAEN